MRILKRLLVVLLVFALILGLLGAAAAVAGYWYLAQDLPPIDSYEDYRPSVSSRVLDREGRLVGEFFRERRERVPLERVPPEVIVAFLAAEDWEFYDHPGVDLVGIARAAYKNAVAGGVVQGGSTITQQVVKTLYLTPERKLIRKLKELILAYRLEQYLTKDQILEIYLNQIYFGHGAYGVATAAETYFGKPVEEVGLAEAAMLAGLPKAPSRSNPFADLGAAKRRQLYVLDQLVQQGELTGDTKQALYEQPIELASPEIEVSPAAEYLEHVRRTLAEKYGDDLLLEGGLVIETELDLDLQVAARAAVRDGVEDLDKRMGWRGVTEHVDWSDAAPVLERLAEQEVVQGERLQGLVRNVDDDAKRVVVDLGSAQGIIPLSRMDWAAPPDPDVHHSLRVLRRPSDALAVGDLVWVSVLGDPQEGGLLELDLEQEPDAQGALIALEPDTRAVVAMVGAYDPAASEFNRAVQARRQPGSSFKPIIYLTALEHGYTGASLLIDSPIIANDDLASFARGGWKPANFDGKFKGPIILRDSLIQSRNVPTIKILKDVGIREVVGTARRLGIESDLDGDLTLALGSSGLPLIELTNVYATIADGGLLREPVFIRRVTDRDGNVLEEAPASSGERVIDADTDFILEYLLSHVIEAGTGRAARSLGRPAGGKTGTTNDYFDAWFMGFTPDLACGVWTGTDERRSLGRGETGSKAALPIWLDFMKAAHEGLPVRPFATPEGVSWACVDRASGEPCGASTSRTQRILLPFRPGTEPRRSAPGATTRPDRPDFRLAP